MADVGALVEVDSPHLVREGVPAQVVRRFEDRRSRQRAGAAQAGNARAQDDDSIRAVHVMGPRPRVVLMSVPLGEGEVAKPGFERDGSHHTEREGASQTQSDILQPTNL